ncbi:hypothetical protein BV900_22100 [Agrobacterium tumefaciens]|nr:hypothetical protein BV900_22100 [Agrobacterium tumefaciens]
MRILFQSERSECGLVCLAMVASANGFDVDLSTLRSRFSISLKGSTLNDLLEIAAQLSLETRVLRCEPQQLRNLRFPAILHWRMNHFVVIAGLQRNGYVIHDPAVGRIVISKAELDEHFSGFVLEAWPGPKFQKQDKRNRLKLGSVFPWSREVKSALICIGAYAVAIEVATLVIPVLQQFVIDDALASADINLLNLLVIAIAIFALGQTVTTAMRGLVQSNLSSSLSLVVPAHLFRHLLDLPVSWFERRSAADVVNRFDSGNTVHKTLTTTTMSTGIDGVVATATLAVMFFYSWKLATIALVSYVVYALIRLIWYSTYRQKSRGSLVLNSRAQSILWETMRGIATIKTFNGTERRREQYVGALSRYVNVQNDIGKLDVLFSFLKDSIDAIEKIVIVYFGARSVMNGELSIGMLTAFLSFRESFASKASNLVNAAVQFRVLGVHLDRLADILLTQPERKSTLPYLGDRGFVGKIDLRNISYRYGSSERDVLRNCNLSIEAGKIIAIVGPSGTGKSTLFKILAGQFEARSGDILIDDVPISVLGLSQYRSLIGVVRQDDMLFEGTIGENIAFLEDRPDYERIREAARKAQIYDEIQRMPMGFNTLIASLGTGLSGGQLQRVMLARALYKNPTILLLDEATSHLDIDNESNLVKVLKQLKMTQIIVAHRPETIAMADQIFDIRTLQSQSTSNQ